MSSVNRGFFWLSDNGRPDNVLFRIEHLVNVTQLSFDSWEMVPFLAISKYSDLVLQELIVSAKINFSWFKSVVLGAGDRETRKKFGASPKNILSRVENFFTEASKPLSALLPFITEKSEDQHEIPINFELPLTQIVDIYVAAQGRKMLSLGLKYASKTIYNGNPLNRWSFLEILLRQYNRSSVGCYVMAYIEGYEPQERIAFNRSLRTFFQIIKTILYENAILKATNPLEEIGGSETRDTLPKKLINQVGFQGTLKELEDFIETLHSHGVDYLVLGGPIVWQKKGLTEILSTF